jgi:multidrug resistance protein, MATE family
MRFPAGCDAVRGTDVSEKGQTALNAGVSNRSRPDWSLHRTILAIALPAMLTNVATALFGLVDVWVIGQLGDVQAQGGVEIGAKLTTTLLVLFNFLRSGTVALTARAAGRGEGAAQAEVLVRALALALTIGTLLLLSMSAIVPAGLAMFGATGGVAAKAQTYAIIRYWAAFPWLLNAVLSGWLIGQRRVTLVLAVEVGSNLLHIALDMSLVLEFGLGVDGIAAATLCSETAKFVALAAVASSAAPARFALASARDRLTWRLGEIIDVLRLNRDLFCRTLLLMAATVLLTRAGARQGPVTLATNSILYQFFILSALMLDGFEAAAQVLCGEAFGLRDRGLFVRLLRGSLIWAAIFAMLISGAYGMFGTRLAESFSAAPTVIGMARRYAGWAILMPVAGFASYVFDGVFVGAGWTRAMLLTMAVALSIFVSLLSLVGTYGDGALWLAFCLFLLLRSLGQAVMLPGLVKRSFVSGGLSVR